MDEEEHIHNHKSRERSTQDRSIRLQWAVSCCLLWLCILTAVSVYQMVGGPLSHKEEKVSSPNLLSQLQHTSSGQESFYLAEKPKAHLTGTKQDSNYKAGTLKWEDFRGLAFTKDGMTYNNKSLYIPKTGYYFVYSQVSFHADGSGLCAHDQKACKKIEYVTQTILKVSANYPVPESLLSGTMSLKDNNEYQAIYLGALFYLRARDMLTVNVSHIQLVDVRVDDRTFFGAYLV